MIRPLRRSSPRFYSVFSADLLWWYTGLHLLGVSPNLPDRRPSHGVPAIDRGHSPSRSGSLFPVFSGKGAGVTPEADNSSGNTKYRWGVMSDNAQNKDKKLHERD